jgi:hypothetical protein
MECDEQGGEEAVVQFETGEGVRQPKKERVVQSAFRVSLSTVQRVAERSGISRPVGPRPRSRRWNATSVQYFIPGTECPSRSRESLVSRSVPNSIG